MKTSHRGAKGFRGPRVRRDTGDPHYLTNGLDEAYTNTFDTPTYHPFGAPTKSILTKKPSLDRISENQIIERTKELPPKLVRLQQPNFKEVSIAIYKKRH